MATDEMTLHAFGIQNDSSVHVIMRSSCSCGGRLYRPPAMVEQKGLFVRRLLKEMKDMSTAYRILAQNLQVHQKGEGGKEKGVAKQRFDKDQLLFLAS